MQTLLVSKRVASRRNQRFEGPAYSKVLPIRRAWPSSLLEQWDNSHREQGASSPPLYARAWRELSGQQQRAAAVLGYDGAYRITPNAMAL